MGGLEDAANKLIVERQKALEDDVARRQREHDERNEAIQEFLNLAKARGFRPEQVYRQVIDGSVQSFSPAGIGWIVFTDHPGEWDTCAAKGSIVCEDGTLRSFTAETIRSGPAGHDRLIASAFYRKALHAGTGDVFIQLADREPYLSQVTREGLAYCASWYMLASS